MTFSSTSDPGVTPPTLPLLLWLVLFALLAGAVSAQTPSPSEALGSVSAAAADPKAGSHHRISADDLLEIRVFQEDDLSTRARVSQDGSILMPLIGKIPVKGKTVSTAASTITAKLRDGYLVNPQVTVNVISLAKRYFTVLGQVASPGQFELTSDRPTDLLAAVGRAGGFTRIANKKKVILKRRTSSGQPYNRHPLQLRDGRYHDVGRGGARSSGP